MGGLDSGKQQVGDESVGRSNRSLERTEGRETNLKRARTGGRGGGGGSRSRDESQAYQRDGGGY